MLRIPIEVEGKDASGLSFTETTYTIMVNRNGARISLKNSLTPGERIIVTNLQREESCPFRVVERTNTLYGSESEWGVECLQPDRNFWGVYFPESTPGAAQGEGKVRDVRDFSILLANVPKGWWVAIAHSEDRVVAKAASLEEALSSAKETGEGDPFMIRVPDKDVPVFFLKI